MRRKRAKEIANLTRRDVELEDLDVWGRAGHELGGKFLFSLANLEDLNSAMAAFNAGMAFGRQEGAETVRGVIRQTFGMKDV